MVLETIVTVFGNVWDYVTDLVILIILIVYLALFFVIQYYLIRGYIWIFKTIYNIPLIKTNVDKLINDYFTFKTKSKKEVPEEYLDEEV